MSSGWSVWCGCVCGCELVASVVLVVGSGSWGLLLVDRGATATKPIKGYALSYGPVDGGITDHGCGRVLPFPTASSRAKGNTASSRAKGNTARKLLHTTLHRTALRRSYWYNYAHIIMIIMIIFSVLAWVIIIASIAMPGEYQGSTLATVLVPSMVFLG